MSEITRRGMSDRARKLLVGATVLSLLTTGVITSNHRRNAVSVSAEMDSSIVEKVADPQTDLLREPNNTSEVGRIKTDKTVRTKGIGDSTQPGQEGSVDIGNNFQVTFSALSSGLQVRKKAIAPADIVFVLDFSGSMTDAISSSDSTPRYQAMVNSLNSAIDTFLGDHPQNRVAVVAYSGNVTTLLNLGRPTKDAQGRYFWYTSSYGTPYVYLTSDTSSNRAVTGGTNIEAGTIVGMNILANNNDTTAIVDGVSVNRVPGVVIMSDGQATYVSSANNWWETTANSGTSGAGNGAYAGNGFMQMLAASYMKNKVSSNYGEAAKIFTIGLGIDSLTGNERDLANTAMNPKEHYSDNNTMANAIRGYYENSYNANNSNFSVQVGRNSNYTVRHPSGTNAQYEPKSNNSNNIVDSLKYNDGYFTAANSDGLDEAFKRAIESSYSTAQGVPVSTDSGASHSGYVYYTDTVGPLMEIKSVDSILYDSHYIDDQGTEHETATRYTNVTKTTNGNVDTYVFNDVVRSNWLHNYENTNLNRVIIKVDHSGPQDVITIEIPEALLPMVDYMVDYDENDVIESVKRNDNTRPIKINYTVGPKDAVGEPGDSDYVASVLDQIANPNLRTAEVENYLNDSSNIVYYQDEGQTIKTVALYANSFKGDQENAVPYAEFTVSDENDFYEFEFNTPLYTDEDCTIPATTYSPDGTYWYIKDVFVVGATGQAADDQDHRKVENLPQANIINVDGQLHARAGARKGLPNNELKSDNTSGSKDYRLSNEWVEGYVLHQHLGNNGRLLVQLPGELKIDKHVTYKDAQGNNYDRTKLNPLVFTKEFTFEISLVDSNGDPVNRTFFMRVTEPSPDGSSEVVDHSRDVTFVNGKAEITLTDAQSAYLEGLPVGVTYTVTEKNIPQGFTLVASSGTTDTIEAGVVYDADFTNNYKLDPITVEDEPPVQKVIEGRSFNQTDAFNIIIEANTDSNPDPTAVPTSPLPMDINGHGTVSGNTINNAFDEITFTKPGTYRYTIREQLGSIPGITYSNSVYIYTIEVSDNGLGKLYISDRSMSKVVDQSGNPVQQEVTVATFTNRYSVETISITPIGRKGYTDTTGQNPLERGDFRFELRPNYDNPVNNLTDESLIDTVPMPASTTGTGRTRKAETYNDVAGNFSFGEITYTSEDVGNTYHYVVQEMIPAEAISGGTTEVIDGVTYIVYKGMKYDATKHYVDVTISEVTQGDETHISADVQFTHQQSASENRVVIKNIYDPEPAEVQIAGTKVLNGRDSLTSEKFEFTLAGYDPETRAAMRNGNISLEEGDFVIVDSVPTVTATVDTLTNGVKKDFTFENMIFKIPGNYRFEAKEVVKSYDGIVIDTRSYIVRVIVEDVGEDALAVTTHTYNGIEYDEGGRADFVNTYSSRIAFADGAVEISKTLNGRALKANDFNFTIEAIGNAPAVPESDRQFTNIAGAADGVEYLMHRLSNLVFTQDDDGKTYQYRISEVIPADAVNDNGVAYGDATDQQKAAGGFMKNGITYDTEYEHIVSFHIIDNKDGTMTVESSVDGGEPVISVTGNVKPAKVDFVNEYESEVIVHELDPLYKRLEGRPWLDTDSFTFTIGEAPGNPQGGAVHDPFTPVTVTKPEEGDTTIIEALGTITFTKPGTYKFVVNEEPGTIEGITYDTNTIQIIIVVEDNGLGQLDITDSYTLNDINTFVNVYESHLDFAGVDLSKTLFGRSGRDREFMIDVRPVASATSTAQQTSERFNVNINGDIVAVSSQGSGVPYVTTAVPSVRFDRTDNGKTYSFEVKEFVPSDVSDAQLDGDTYKMRDGVYYNTNGIDHYRVDITVTDNYDGTMTTTVVWTAHDADHQEIEGMGGTDTDNETPVLPFENTYDASGSVVVNAIKDLEGRGTNSDAWLDSDEFDFEIEAMKLDEDGHITIVADDSDNIPMPEYTKATITANNQTDLVGSDGTQHHAVDENGKNGWTININEEHLSLDTTDNIYKGDFYYRIKEVIPADAVNGDGIAYGDATEQQKAAGGFVKDGITYSATYRYVHVHAEDTRTGSISTTMMYVTMTDPDTDLGAAPVFTNRYAASGKVQIPVVKTLNGKQWDENDTYTFTLTASGSNPLPAAAGRTVTIDKDTENHYGKFGEISFTKPGTYDYLVTESQGSVPGVEYDSNDKRYVRIVITDNTDGTLAVESMKFYTDAQYATEQEYEGAANFINAYKSTGELVIEGTKQLLGRDFKSGDKWEFTISGPANAPLPNPATISISPASNSGNTYDFAFSKITFTQDDVARFPEGIVYEIREIKGDRTIITYDEHVEKVKVTLADDGEGNITPTLVYLENEGDESEDEILFVNEYTSSGEVTIKVIKDLDGRQWIASDEFIFRITPHDENSAFDANDQHDDATAKIDEDQVVVATEHFAQYFASPYWILHYTIDDLDKVDSGTGRMYDDFYYDLMEVVPDDAVNANGIRYVDAPDSVKAAGGFKKNGITYTNEKHTVHVHAEDNGLGTIITSVYYDETTPGDSSTAKGATPVFINFYEVEKDSLSVQKAWSDENNKYNFRTDVIMHLYYLDSNDNLIQVEVEPKTISKNATGDQAVARWDDLPVTEWYYDETDGVHKERKIRYVILEEAVGGYTTSYTYLNTTSTGMIPVELDGDDTTVQKVSVLNTLEVPKTTVSAVKVWNDDNDRDGIRPETVIFELYQDGTATGRRVTLDGTPDEGTAKDRETTAWTATFSELQQYKRDADNKLVPVTYTVSEVNVPTGYEAIVTGCMTEGFTITNTHVPEKTTANVTKAWNDQNDHDGLRPDYVRFTLWKSVNGVESQVSTKSYVITAEEQWKLTLEDLPKYENGTLISYFFKEAVPANYTANGTGENNANVASGGTITNTHTPGKVTLEVEKKWVDNDNAEGMRPENLVVTLYANGLATDKTVTLNETNEWKDSFTDLEAMENGVAINYTVEENVPDGYSAAVSRSGNKFTITNTHENHTIDLSGEKVWNDAGNEDTRPESITVLLYADGSPATDSTGAQIKKTVTADDGWKWSFTGVPEFNGEGNKIVYTFVEQTIAGYTKQEVNGGRVIINTPNTVTATVNKYWDDSSNRDGVRPDSVTFALMRKYGDTDEKVKDVVVTGPTNNNVPWTVTIYNLPDYIDGEKVTYYWIETVPSGYTANGTGDNHNIVANNGSITNTHTNDITSISVTKIWDDDNNRDGKRPASVEVKLYANGEQAHDGQGNEIKATLSTSNQWKYTFEDLPTRVNGLKINYSVVETAVGNGYSTSYGQTSASALTVTNSRSPEKISIFGSKTWHDTGDESTRDTIYVTLQKKSGENWVNVENDTHRAVTFKDNGWDFLFEDVYKYENGALIVYRVVEEDIDGYITQIWQDDDGTWSVVNTEIIEISGKKIWKDGDLTISHEAVEIKLMANGQAAKDKDGNTVANVMTASDGTYKFINLPAFDSDGKKIVYTVDEVSVPEGYEKTVDGYNIINTLKNKPVTLTKVWDDEGNEDKRTDVVIHLDAVSGNNKTEDVKTFTVAADAEGDDLTATFNVPVYDANGALVVYSVRETDVPDKYVSSVSQNGDRFTVTNTYVPDEVVTITATKVWDDDGNEEMRRDVKVHLFGSTEDGWRADFGQKTIALTDDPAEAVWEGMPKYHYGQLISYEVKEDAIPMYTTSYENEENDWTITNSLSSQMTEISAVKVWEDSDDLYEARPDSVTFYLESSLDGTTWTRVEDSDRVIESEDDVAEWTDLAMEELVEGEVKTILYRVAEENPGANYVSTVEAGEEAGTYVVTNTYIPPTTQVKAVKVWNDNDDYYGERPAYVTFKLIQVNGEDETELASKVIYGDAVGDDLSVTWSDLPTYVDDQKVTYKVVEEGNGSKYAVAYVEENGVWTITNTYTVNSTSVKAEKRWFDEEGEAIEESPVAVTLQLIKKVNGYGESVADEKTIPAGSSGDDLKVEWTGLATIEDGKEVTYSVNEVPVEGYTKQVVYNSDDDVYVITNTKLPDHPEYIFVSYVDYKNDEGEQIVKTERVLYDERYDVTDPEDPSHDDESSFTGWDENNDEFYNIIYVARYEVPEVYEIVVTYIDPKNDNDAMVLKSEITDDPESVRIDVTPSHNRSNFIGWQLTKDSAGNWIYVAKYEEICPNNECEDCRIPTTDRYVIPRTAVGN